MLTSVERHELFTMVSVIDDASILVYANPLSHLPHIHHHTDLICMNQHPNNNTIQYNIVQSSSGRLRVTPSSSETFHQTILQSIQPIVLQPSSTVVIYPDDVVIQTTTLAVHQHQCESSIADPIEQQINHIISITTLQNVLSLQIQVHIGSFISSQSENQDVSTTTSFQLPEPTSPD